jgi:hypothetical protein
MKETDDNIFVFGDSNYRFDIPQSMIMATGRNVILDIDFPEIYKYRLTKMLYCLKESPLKTK